MSALDKFLKAMQAGNSDLDDEFDGEYEEQDEYVEEPAPKKVKEEVVTPVKNNKTTTSVFGKSQKREDVAFMPSVCIIVLAKDEYSQKDIADKVLQGKTVVLNLEGTDTYKSQRYLDFMSGVAYSIGGRIQKASSFIFVITPPNVEISGDIGDLLGSDEEMM